MENNENRYTAAVITVSDKGFRGEREDTSGPNLVKMLTEAGYDVRYTSIIPDDRAMIKKELIKASDELGLHLILTTGGTGFSPRDITPEATMEVVERPTPGIPEAMRAESLRITPRGCLSRSAAGIRGRSLIINLPGSLKASAENLNAVLGSLDHGLKMLLSEGSADCAAPVEHAVIKAVCISQVKGVQKTPVDMIELVPDHGITGDAHAGNWHRQVSLLGAESVAKVQEKIDFPLQPGAFAENVLTEGLCLYELPVGTRVKIGTATCEVTQIGKECHFDCEIRRKAGDCVMPREGIFVKVLLPGTAKAGDYVVVMR